MAELDVLKSRIDGHDYEFKRNESEHHRIRESVDQLKNRPPIWITIIMSLLMAACGFLVSKI